MKKRNQCVICDSVKLEFLYNFQKFPIYMGISKNNNDKFYDQHWVICKDCGTIQLQYLIDLDELYGVPHNPAVGNMWRMHHKKFAKYAQQYLGKNILEIGGGNLIIANNICENNKDIRKYIIYDKHFDYTENKHNAIYIKQEFFTENQDIENEIIDTIILSHTFEHFYDINKYCKKFNEILSDKGKIIISIPHIKKWLSNNFTNALQFEHTYMVDENNLQFILSKHAFKLINIEWFSEYNLFITFEKQEKLKVFTLNNNYEENKKIFSNFIEFQINNIKNINEQLKKYENYDLYIFGCHVFAQYMTYFGLNESMFKGLLDNDINKQQYRLYGTSLITFSPNIIKYVKKPCVIVQMGIYTEEICEQLIHLNKNVKIIK